MFDENFSYGYNDGICNLRSSPNDKFQCYYTKSRRPFLSLREEAKRVCDKIADAAKSLNRVPTILLSGGLDSEIVVRSFIDSKQEFKTISNRFQNDLNIHEIDYIEKLKKKFTFDHTYYDLDVVQFLISERAEILIHDSKCTQPEMLPTMELIYRVYENFNGYPILGNGDLYVSKDMIDNKPQWNYTEFEYILAWMRFCVKENIQGALNFFQYTPEIVLSVGRDQIMGHLFNTSPEGMNNCRSRKYLVYKKNWIDIELRSKFHGSENIKDLCNEIKFTKCKDYFQYTDQWKMPIESFLNFLEFNK